MIPMWGEGKKHIYLLMLFYSYMYIMSANRTRIYPIRPGRPFMHVIRVLLYVSSYASFIRYSYICTYIVDKICNYSCISLGWSEKAAGYKYSYFVDIEDSTSIFEQAHKRIIHLISFSLLKLKD